MNIKNLFNFAKQDKAKQSAKPSAAIYSEEAISQLMIYLTRYQDMDAVLKQLGIGRDKLRNLLSDDEIYQAVETRTDALLSTPMRIEPSEGPGAEFIMETLKPVIQTAITGAFQARLFGYSVLEAIYKPLPDGRIGLAYLGEKPFEWFEPKPDGRLLYFPDSGAGGTTGIEVDQEYKFFLTRNRPTYLMPFGEAMLSRLYWPWFFRTNGWKFWGKFLERFGSPLLVGKSTDNRAMAEALLSAHSQSVIGIGHEDSVDAVGMASANAGQAFDMFEAATIRRIQKVILGQTLTSGTDNGSGNRALGAVHNSVREDKRNSDIKLVQATIQSVVNALCKLNNFEPHEVIFADEVGLEKDRSERDKNLYVLGVRFQKSYFEDNYDLNDTDFELTQDPVNDTQGDNQGGNPPPNDPKKKPGVKASIETSNDFGRRKVKFSKDQQEVEDLVDRALEAAGLPLDAVRSAVLAATSPEDLQDRLFALIGSRVSDDGFREVLEKALFAADVLGYIHAEGK